MQCPICKFNNLPGTKVCTRCRAQLVLDDDIAPEHLQPPRAGKYKKYRSIVYSFSRLDNHQFSEKSITAGRYLSLLLLSVIPGLGHMLVGKRRAALGIFGGWLFLMTSIVFLYSSTLSGLLLGIVIALHSFVFFDIYDIRRRYPKMLSQIRVVFTIAIIVAINYFWLQSYANRFVRVVIAPCDFPRWQVEKQDSLLFIANSNRYKGELVCYRDSSTVIRPHAIYLGSHGSLIGCIIGLPGDKIDVSADGVRINGNKVDQQYLGHQWKGLVKPFAFTIPPNYYFIPNQFIFRGNFRRDNYIRLWRNAYLVYKKQIIGRAIAIYFPLARRRFFSTTTNYSGNN